MKNSQLTTHNLQQQKGFTLLESLVAIAVFSVGVSTAVYVMTQSLQAGERTKRKIVAAHLAQEGLEVVRNIRDRNWFAGRVWYQNMDALTDACIQWNTEYNTIEETCALGQNLYFDGTNYIMANVTTPYARRITAQLEPGPPERLHVTSRVTCGSGCSVTLDEYLYDWK